MSILLYTVYTSRRQEVSRGKFIVKECTELVKSEKRIVVMEHLPPASLGNVDIVRNVPSYPGTPFSKHKITKLSVSNLKTKICTF